MAVYSRINKRTGAEVWYIRFLGPDGKWIKEKVGCKKTAAEKRYRERWVQVQNGVYVNPRKVKAEGVTFDDFAVRFERDYGAQRRSDFIAQRVRRIKLDFSGRLMADIRQADLDAYRAKCMRPVMLGGYGLGPSTTRKNLIVLALMFKMAKRWSVIEVNPAADLEKPAEPAHTTRYLTEDEWALLHEKAEPWLKPILHMALLTGARLKEVVGLTWDNIKDGVLCVSADNKTGEPRSLKLTPEIREILDAQVRRLKSPWVFLDADGNPYTTARQRNRISQRTRAAAKAAKLPGVTFHKLRHTAGTWMAQAGVAGPKIGRVLGHATPVTTKRYIHLGVQDTEQPMDAIAARLRTAPKIAPDSTAPNSTAGGVAANR